MPHQMTQFGENKHLAGQFAGIQASGHAKYCGVGIHSGRSAGQQGRRVDLFKAKLGKQRAECGEFFFKQRSHSLDRNIFAGDPEHPTLTLQQLSNPNRQTPYAIWGQL